MAELIIRCRKNGPLIVEGDLQVLDHEGRPFEINRDKPAVALCRCGQSQRKPFCDGSHRDCGFIADESA